MRFERKTLLLGAVAALPAFVALLLVFLGSRIAWPNRLMILGAVLVATLLALSVLHEHVTGPLRTVANLLAALREEDYSVRGRGARADDALGEVLIEVNELGSLLREQRLGALEASALLRTVIGEIDAAIFTFDGEQRLRLVNRAGERLLDTPAERLLGRNADDLGLQRCLDPGAASSLEIGGSRWGIRLSFFREHGQRHTLLLLTDLSQALRDEERQAWQRLVRVLGHELNNSLAPIKSIAATLLSNRSNEDLERGLSIIAERAESLTRFMDAYSRLARLPRPTFGRVNVGEMVERVAALERRLDVAVQPGPQLTIDADADQLEQAVINLVRNAADASLETGGAVTVGWRTREGAAEITVSDEGRGLGGSANLFVPFFTTKPGGTGIGLALSRQIADAHGGTLRLENRAGGTGCVARLSIPARQLGL